MIEINITTTYAEAQQRAHQERSDALVRMVRALPKLIKSVRART